MTRAASLVLLALTLSACAVGPNYKRPRAETPPNYKSADNWKPAQPSSADISGDWWTLFGDAQLDDLERQVLISNQNLAAAAAAYAQARAIVAEDRADLFPTVDLSAGAARAGAVKGGGETRNYTASVGASWAPDIWGRIRRTVESARASAQASGDDLAAATLSAQSELAIDYIQLRAADEQKRLLDLTAANDAEALRISQNRYNVGVAGKSDVASAQSQYATAQAQDVDVERTRGALEHAIAVLVGKPPAEFSLSPTAWKLTVPGVPLGVPSSLLERRPDIAAAERRAKAANAQIGVAVAAFFPDITLNGAVSGAGSALAGVTSASNLTWTLGAQAADTLFAFGRRVAAVHAARASYDEAVANYRQSVLTAFQNVEDALTAARVLEREQTFTDQSTAAADEAERIAANQYKAGTIDHTTLLVAENAAQNARISALQTQSARMSNAVSLIEALGGGWNASDVK